MRDLKGVGSWTWYLTSLSSLTFSLDAGFIDNMVGFTKVKQNGLINDCE